MKAFLAFLIAFPAYAGCTDWLAYLAELDRLEKLRSEDVMRIYREQGFMSAAYRDLFWQELIVKELEKFREGA